jgi:hypothetical protein
MPSWLIVVVGYRSATNVGGTGIHDNVKPVFIRSRHVYPSGPAPVSYDIVFEQITVAVRRDTNSTDRHEVMRDAIAPHGKVKSDPLRWKPPLPSRCKSSYPGWLSPQDSQARFHNSSLRPAFMDAQFPGSIVIIGDGRFSCEKQSFELISHDL